jgi:hypothetical protein
MVLNVFAEDKNWPDVVNDVSDPRPKPSRILLAKVVTCDADGLAGVSGSDAMNFATPRLSVEGRYVAPDRSFVQDSFLHTLDHDRAVKRFPLNVTADSSLWDSKSESKFKSSCT